MRSEQRASPSSAAELGQATRARVRFRPRALIELRRPAEDHWGQSGAAGDREDPHAPRVAGACAAVLSCPRSSAASDLTIPIRHCSGGSARRAAVIDCVRVVAGPMEAAWRPGITRRRRPGRPFSAGLSTPNGSPPAVKDAITTSGQLHAQWCLDGNLERAFARSCAD